MFKRRRSAEKTQVLLTSDSLSKSNLFIIFLITLALTTSSQWLVLIAEHFSNANILIINDKVTSLPCSTTEEHDGYICKLTKKYDLSGVNTSRQNILGIGMIYEVAKLYCKDSNIDKSILLGSFEPEYKNNFYLQKYRSISINDLGCRDFIYADFWTSGAAHRYGRIDGLETVTNSEWITVIQHLSEYFRTLVIPMLASLCFFIFFIGKALSRYKVFNYLPSSIEYNLEITLFFIFASPLISQPLFLPVDIYPRILNYVGTLCFSGFLFSSIINCNVKHQLPRWLLLLTQKSQRTHLSGLHFSFLFFFFPGPMPRANMYIVSLLVILIISLFFILKQKNLIAGMVALFGFSDIAKFFSIGSSNDYRFLDLLPTSVSAVTCMATINIFLFLSYLKSLHTRSRFFVSSEVSARLAHDIRGLAAVPSLRSNSIDNETKQQISTAVIARVKTISRDYLSRLKEKRTSTNSLLINLQRPLAELINEITLGHPMIRISFKNELPHDSMRTIKDPEQLERCVENILINALQATEMTIEPVVQIIIALENNKYLNISIADNGPKIPKNVLSKLKDGSLISEKKEGFGIGLHSTIDYLRSINGQLLYAEQKEMKSFSLVLPTEDK